MLTDEQVADYLRERRPMSFETTDDEQEVVLRMTWTDIHTLIEFVAVAMDALCERYKSTPVDWHFYTRFKEAISRDEADGRT